jgi:hypothetical protein
MTQPAGADWKQDSNTLLHSCLAHAEALLKREHEVFFPFGIGLRPDGEVELVQMATVGGVDAPQVVDALWDRFRTEAAAGELVACAVAYDANVGEGRDRRDAVAVAIEHRDGEPATLFTPYRQRRLRGVRYDVADVFRQRTERRAFRQASG